MATKVADHVLARLREWGVQHVFGYPGDGINGLLAAWGRADDNPRFIQARHEEMAAFEAVGYSKFSGRVGVCAAKLYHVPAVATVGQTTRIALGGSYKHEFALLIQNKNVAPNFFRKAIVP